MGIPKSSVNAIRESDITVENQMDARSMILLPKAPHALSVTGDIGEKPETVGAGKAPASFAYFQHRKAKLKAERDAALKRFRAAARDKDAEAKRKAIEDMTKASAQLFELTNELKKNNNGVLPDGWQGL